MEVDFLFGLAAFHNWTASYTRSEGDLISLVLAVAKCLSTRNMTAWGVAFRDIQFAKAIGTAACVPRRASVVVENAMGSENGPRMMLHRVCVT